MTPAADMGVDTVVIVADIVADIVVDTAARKSREFVFGMKERKRVFSKPSLLAT